MYVRQKFVWLLLLPLEPGESQEKSINYPRRMRTTFVILQDLVLRKTRENMGRNGLWTAGA